MGGELLVFDEPLVNKVLHREIYWTFIDVFIVLKPTVEWDPRNMHPDDVNLLTW